MQIPKIRACCGELVVKNSLPACLSSATKYPARQLFPFCYLSRRDIFCLLVLYLPLFFAHKGFCSMGNNATSLGSFVLPSVLRLYCMCLWMGGNMWWCQYICHHARICSHKARGWWGWRRRKRTERASLACLEYCYYCMGHKDRTQSRVSSWSFVLINTDSY